MTYRTLACAVLALCVLPAYAQEAMLCDGKTERRLDEEHYLAVTDRVYVYLADISSTWTGGWKAFDLRVLTGSYKRPFLLDSAYFRERDLNDLLKTRAEITQTVLPVPAGSRNGKAQPRMVTVKDGERTAELLIEVKRVVPVRGGNEDHLFLTCAPKR